MGKARVLAIDDQAYFRELIEEMLVEDGFEVATSESGEAALHRLEGEDFDVVLMDLVMSEGVDGPDLVQKIRQRLPEQPIIVMAGVVDIRTAAEAIKLGASDTLLKPFDKTDLSRAVGRVVQQKNLRVEHTRLMEENLDFMGVLSLFERAMALFGSLSVEPVASRIAEALCLETRAQSGVLWVDHEGQGERFEISGVQGLSRIEEEPETLVWEDFVAHEGAGLESARSLQVGVDPETGQGGALLLALRIDGKTLGILRLSDKLDGHSFSKGDQLSAEKFCSFGATALRNALRFRALERRSLRDPETKAYTQAYFEDAVRNEIQKATRFGHRFSILRIDFDEPSGGAQGHEAFADMAEVVESALRSTDLLASRDAVSYSVLLPQTDALGAGILAQRIRKSFAGLEGADESPKARVTSATFPVDGTQLHGLREVLEQRIERSRSSLIGERPEWAEPQAIDSLLDRMLELGSVEPVAMEGQIFQFVLEDVGRRPADRGVLFVSPGARWLPEVLETIHEMQGRGSRTELVIVAEAEGQASAERLTWATKTVLDARRPFLVYFGDGPAFAMIGQVNAAREKAPIFQTCDRGLVEHLAFELQRELGIQLSV